MIYIIVVSSLISFATGIITGAIVHFHATDNNISLIKRDARTALQKQAADSFAAGYMRAYADKTAKRAKKSEEDMTLIMNLVSI